MENILVTGGAGFIGFNMLKHLLKKKVNIYTLIRGENIKNIDKINALSKNINIITCSIDELLKNNNLPNFDRIFHFATVGIDPNFNDISQICDVNIKMTCSLIDLAKKCNTKLIVNVGSCFEYGDNQGNELCEDDTCCPRSLYAISKNAATNLASVYAKSKNVSLVTVRPFGVFGSGESSSRLTPLVIEHGLKKEKLELTAGEQIRDFVNVNDVVRSMYKLSLSDNLDNYGIYNICSDNPVTVKDFIFEIINTLGFDPNLYQFGKIPYRKNEAMCFIGCNDKLLKTIDYKFPNNHKDGILELFNEIQEKLSYEL